MTSTSTAGYSHLVDQLVVEVGDLQLAQTAHSLVFIARGEELLKEKLHLANEEPDRSLPTTDSPDIVQPGDSMLHAEEELGSL